jgi:hypothetical protein
MTGKSDPKIFSNGSPFFVFPVEAYFGLKKGEALRVGHGTNQHPIAPRAFRGIFGG